MNESPNPRINESPPPIPYRRILVTGATGFLGHHVLPALRAAAGGAEIVGVGRADYDLLAPGRLQAMLADVQPDAVVHLAARVGGVVANARQPADFFYENAAINTALFEAARRAGVKKLVVFLGGCCYPESAPSPLREDDLWNGRPYLGSAGYAVAKRMQAIQSWAYRQQYGFNSIILIPGNLYGEWDHFDLEGGHVIPALIRKCVEAREQGLPEIAAFGSGRPTRDFVYAGDVAALVPWFLAHYDSSDPVNLSSGVRVSIRDLADAVRRAAGYEGRIAWDASKPDGQLDKVYDVSRLRALGLSCPTPLEQGLTCTVEWFIRNKSEV